MKLDTLRVAWLLPSAALCLLSTLADAAKNEPEPWPSTRTKAPTKAAWNAAPRVDLERVWGERARGCEMRRVEEWLSVRCPHLKTSAITQLGGTRSDVSYFIEPPGADRVPGAGELVFPVREKERRVFSFWTLGPGYDGPLTVVPAIVIQSSWLAAQGQPSITLTDALHEPVATKTHPRQAKER